MNGIYLMMVAIGVSTFLQSTRRYTDLISELLGTSSFRNHHVQSRLEMDVLVDYNPPWYQCSALRILLRRDKIHPPTSSYGPSAGDRRYHSHHKYSFRYQMRARFLPAFYRSNSTRTTTPSNSQPLHPTKDLPPTPRFYHNHSHPLLYTLAAYLSTIYHSLYYPLHILLLHPIWNSPCLVLHHCH